ncbi:MAG: SOS response-associated peptidase [Fimbriimonas sp.]
MCIRYNRDDGRLIRYSKRIRKWVLETDYREGKDLEEGYEPEEGLVPDWTRKVIEYKSIFPGDVGGIVLAGEGDVLEQVEARWGIIPHWADDPKYGKKNAYNARSETVAEKPTFRTAFAKRRCIIPVPAFYERNLKEKRWLRIGDPKGEPLAVAGLWETPNHHTEIPTYTMVTTEPNAYIGNVHDRMPVILDPDGVEGWLDPKSRKEDLLRLLIPAPEDALAIEDGGPILPPKRKRSAGDGGDQGELL